MSRQPGTGLPSLVSESEYFQWIKDFSNMCMAKIAENVPGASVVLEKTPAHGSCAADILKVFPEAYFVHVVRDPRGVVASLRAASRDWGKRWAPGQLIDACFMWKDRVSRAQEIQEKTSRYREVRYEDLHENGPENIARLFAWLDEEVCQAHAEQYVDACSIDKLRSGTAGAPWDLNREPEAFYRRALAEGWREELTPGETAIIERLTKKQMAQLGYEPVSGRRARVAAKARLRTYKACSRLEAAAHNLTEFLKP